MKEKPIIFSSDMIQAILDGRKSMTRRVIKPQPEAPLSRLENSNLWTYTLCEREWKCPYEIGMRLWVKETWTQDINIAEGATGTLYYRANENSRSDLKWKSPRFMPRWASRITLEIVNVRVERLWEITSEDAIKESANEWFIEHGLSWKDSDKPYSIYAFQHLWDSLYTKKPELQWEANPWVWVIEFKKEEG